MSHDYKYYLDYAAAANMPPVVSLYEAPAGKLIKVLEDNAALKNKMAGYNISPQEFFSFKTADNTQLNGCMIKPANFDPKKKYPVLMFVYGGPGSQEVLNKWAGNYLWFQYLANKGLVLPALITGEPVGAARLLKK